MSFKKGVKITKEFILSNIEEEAIFERYFRPVVFGRDIRNVARPDEEPGCRFYISKTTGRIRFKDFGTGHNWDCFEAAIQHPRLKALDFPEVLKRIAKDFGLIKVNGQITVVDNLNLSPNRFEERKELANRIISKKIVLKNKRRIYKWNERKYWGQFHINDSVLHRFYVYGFDSAIIIQTYHDGSIRRVPIYHRKKELKFAYYLGNGEWKLYFPERTKGEDRFIQLKGDTIQGWYLLPEVGENIVFTKSYKDIMGYYVLDNVPAIAAQSENILIPVKIIAEIKDRFDNIFIHYDNDFAGMKAMTENIAEYPFLKPILFAKDEPKDLTDNIKEYNIDKVRDLILPILNENYING